MHATYPQVTLEIEVDTTPHLREALLSQTLDVTFLLGPLAEPRTQSVPLSVYPMGWIARADLPIAQPADAAGLRAWPIITYPRNTRPYVNVREVLSQPGEAMPRIYANASLSTIVRMALEGIGIPAVPPVLVRDQIEAGSLRCIAGAPSLNPLTFTATWLVGSDDHAARAIVALAKETAGGEPFAAG